MTYLEHYKKTVYEGEEIVPSDERITWNECVNTIYGPGAICRERCWDCWNREMPVEETVKPAEEDAFDDASVVLQEAFNETFHVDPETAKKAAEIADKMTREHILPVKEIRAAIERAKENVVTPLPKILDSGNRREFESGAVRDIQEGKGRCDLLPLDVVSEFTKDAVTGYICNFQDTGDIDELYNAWDAFAETRWHDNPTMFLELAKHFEEGAKKYGDNNWRKGIPVRCYIDSAVRHYLKYLRGDKDEPHDRAFCWNIMCAIWTCKHHPALNEYDGRTDK